MSSLESNISLENRVIVESSTKINPSKLKKSWFWRTHRIIDYVTSNACDYRVGNLSMIKISVVISILS